MSDDPTYTPKDAVGYRPTFGVKVAPASAPPPIPKPEPEPKPVEKSEEESE